MLKLHGHPLGGKKRSSNDKQNSRRSYMGESAGTAQPSGLTVNYIDPSPPSTLEAIAQSGMP